MKNIQPATFWVLLRWLYGQTFKVAIDATNSVLSLDFLGDILKVADYCRLPLKDVEDMIINDPYTVTSISIAPLRLKFLNCNISIFN